MRIERGDHAVDRALHQLGVVGLLDIAGPDPLEHVAEQIELYVGAIGTGRGFGGRNQMRPLGSGDKNGQTRARYRAEEKGEVPAHHWRAFSLSTATIRSIGGPAPEAGATTQRHFGRIKAAHTGPLLALGGFASLLAGLLTGFQQPILPGGGLGAEAAFGPGAQPIAELGRNIAKWAFHTQ